MGEIVLNSNICNWLSKCCREQESKQAVPYPDVVCWLQHS